jgi:hypothetical protein
MFGRLFGKKEKAPPSRLSERKLQMDELFYFRPWSVMPVERDLLSGMGAFVEDAVSEDDFHEPMQEFLEEIFYRNDEDGEREGD